MFPGGVREDQDTLELDLQNSASEEAQRILAAQNTVIRETREETGLELHSEQLTPFSNWLTPNFRIKRYNTLFFVATLNTAHAHQAIQIDEQEIVDHKWVQPAAAIAAQATGSLALNGPSFVTLKIIENCADSLTAHAALAANSINYYEPRGLKTQSGVATIYHGDCAYDLDDLNLDAVEAREGVKHRLYMHQDSPWEFIDSRTA